MDRDEHLVLFVGLGRTIYKLLMCYISGRFTTAGFKEKLKRSAYEYQNNCEE